MPGFDKREAAYTQARNDLVEEYRSRGLADMSEHERGEQVARIVDELEERYPELDQQMRRRLVGEGLRADFLRGPELLDE